MNRSPRIPAPAAAQLHERRRYELGLSTLLESRWSYNDRTLLRSTGQRALSLGLVSGRSRRSSTRRKPEMPAEAPPLRPRTKGLGEGRRRILGGGLGRTIRPSPTEPTVDRLTMHGRPYDSSVARCRRGNFLILCPIARWSPALPARTARNWPSSCWNWVTRSTGLSHSQGVTRCLEAIRQVDRSIRSWRASRSRFSGRSVKCRRAN